MANKRYTLVLNFGYAESAGVSYMPWVSNDKYKDAKEAVTDLATFLRDQYLKENEQELKKCCQAAKLKDPSAKFCPKCGFQLDEKQFDGEHFSDWLRQMGDCDNDRMGEFVEYDPEHRWQFGFLEGCPNQRFIYQADWVLAAALGHPKDKDKTFEVICKERTKHRKESFSYY